MVNIKTLKQRKQIIQLIRTFFDNKDYLEIETPIISPALIPESNIETFKTTHVHPFKGKREGYLIPSPEVWLKRFLSRHKCNIYEISKCFRNSEQSGRHHNPEFTMIEYYTMDADHMDSLQVTIDLLDYINNKFSESKLSKEHQIMTMEEAFIKYAGFSLEEYHSIKDLQFQMERLGINYDQNDSWETSFNRIFIDCVEPNLPTDKNLFLTDFPSNIKTLAKNIPGTPWAQRWELYINGIECGNCYNEERDVDIIRTYFDIESDEKKFNLTHHTIDTNYPDLFTSFPECSGGAIGIDRLIMGILGIESIEGVILFPYRDNI